MLLNQAVQRGLLGVVALVVIRGAVCCPLGLPVDGLHARPRGGDLRRSEAVRCSSMAQSAACRLPPAGAYACVTSFGCSTRHVVGLPGSCLSPPSASGRDCQYAPEADRSHSTRRGLNGRSSKR